MLTTLLKNIPLFSGLSPAELREMLEFSEKRRYPSGSIVLYKGDVGQVIYLILRGKVKVVLFDEDGKEIILSTLKAGNYFGEMSAFDQMPRSATIVTIEESEFLMIGQKSISDQIKKNPQLALKLLSEMSRRLREADEQISSLALLDVSGRVAQILLKLSRETPIKKGTDYTVIPRPALQDIASMAGASRETVSRILSDFSKRGLVSLAKKNIIIYGALELNNEMY
jgi:CRP/FNR family cyclic AMP-dependent transcriptional regulator